MNENQLMMNISPHIRSKTTTQTIMRDVIIALIPALIAAVINYGPRSIAVVAISVAAAVASEYIAEKAMKKAPTINDLSAVVTGILVAYCCPVGIPFWMVAFGSAVAIIIVKQMFGGIGQNFANPAITARIILFISFATEMTDWSTGYPDIIAGSTPLASVYSAEAVASSSTVPVSYMDLFMGNISGCLGETCKLALLIGAAYLLCKGIIKWYTPVAFIGSVFLLSAALGEDPVFAILSGGVFLGAFFMATDYVTSPSTNLGRIIFGIGAGCITVLIRLYCSYPEGVSFGILLMNILSPHIERWTMPKSFGGEKK